MLTLPADLQLPYRRTPPEIMHSSVEFSRGQRLVNASVSDPVSSGAALNWAHSCGVEVTLAISGRLFGVTKKVHTQSHTHTPDVLARTQRDRSLSPACANIRSFVCLRPSLLHRRMAPIATQSAPHKTISGRKLCCMRCRHSVNGRSDRWSGRRLG